MKLVNAAAPVSSSSAGVDRSFVESDEEDAVVEILLSVACSRARPADDPQLELEIDGFTTKAVICWNNTIVTANESVSQ